jgi:hypothetical protein
MSLFDLVFGCWHKRCTFPITVRGKLRRTTSAASVTGTYVVCLDCGREFPYDCRYRSQRGLRPMPDDSRKPSLCIWSGELSAVSWAGRGSTVP